MNNLVKIDPREIDANPVSLIGQQWMLVTSGSLEEGFNTMTASWGALGFVWNKPVVFVFVRPQRHTFGFMEGNNTFTLSFFPEKYRKALQICGSKSGRDTDKVALAGITPFATEGGSVAFREAELVIECCKAYASFLEEKDFLDEEIVPQVYPGGDFHKMYIAVIEAAWRVAP